MRLFIKQKLIKSFLDLGFYKKSWAKSKIIEFALFLDISEDGITDSSC